MEKYYLALLNNTQGVNKKFFEFLLAKLGSCEAVWQADLKVLLELGLPAKLAEKFWQNKKKLSWSAQKLADFCREKNIQVITYQEDTYPQLLKNTYQPPLALFMQGSLPAEKEKVLAVVGSRNASAYGLSVAREFTADLAGLGFTIVSGGAKGIDTAAHQGCLVGAGFTIAVFGCGIDIVYPSENQKLFAQILAGKGCLLTEYLPGTRPLSWHFPARNRIIAGLSRGVLVVEADKKSGSLITARLALEENREVYGVPGSIYSTGSAGVHNLLKQGALLVDTPEDILQDLGLNYVSKISRENLNPAKHLKVNQEAQLIYTNMVTGKSYAADELIMLCKLDLPVVSYSLLELEIAGLVELKAGLYQKLERSS